ncbi:amino acid ABC transporter substrate-binding protein [Vibrio sp. vnigr-6D03]|uniref:amino acid ABC transporter substrate-binding protein n=1 Tax=Vibrio sp. vnigr-6D03 TaxID=2058088 RepID=UPI0015E0AF81|nr:amino acid ABC transporter substrate-binding protein [Vibrio sp. vnigr-6D03]
MKKIVLGILIVVLFQAERVWGGETLKAVQERGYLRCGVGIDDFGFATRSRDGKWKGFDVDFCRAIAAAVLKDVEAVQYIPLDSQGRFKALANKEVDVIIRTATWTFQRDVSLGLSFTGVTLYDEQRLLINKYVKGKKTVAIEHAAELDKATVCVTKGTTSLENIKDYIQQNNLSFEILETESQAGRWHAFLRGRCQLMTSEVTDLLGGLTGLLDDPNGYHLLSDVISREPLGPYVRDDDPNWFDVVRWSSQVPILAEYLGLSSQNVTDTNTRLSPEAKRLLNTPEAWLDSLGLDAKWAFRIIRDVGNYEELYRQNLKEVSIEGAERGVNELWTNGGLHQPAPFR